MNKSSNAARRGGHTRQDPLAKAVEAVRRKSALPARLGIVLGSGFQGLLADVEPDASIPYSALPGFAQATVAGHAGRLVCGRLRGLPVIVLAGRSHYYEGHDMAHVTFGVRLVAKLGVDTLLLTNAAGGINPNFQVGDFMMLTDHINLMGANPLRSPAGGQQRFVDLTEAYDPGLQALVRQAARRARVRLHKGVYLAVSGPSYETPAEIRAFHRLGADAVGMSTVPEVIVARQLGLRVAALSCITNLAAGISKQPLSHAEVLQTGAQVSRQAATLLGNFAKLYAKE